MRRATLLFSAATAALAVSVVGDLILTALRVGASLTSDAIIPIASLSVEIGSVVAIVIMIANAARLMARTAGALGA
jgi:hypothetical protein